MLGQLIGCGDTYKWLGTDEGQIEEGNLLTGDRQIREGDQT
ncbi:hypothetical protein [Bacillus thuringiensis]|nr:hypothetical protein [Bacillus thuringiensis]